MDGIENNSNVGIVPRVIDSLFKRIENNNQIGGKSTLEASFLEISNENVTDMLSNGEEILSEDKSSDYLDTTNSKRVPVQKKCNFYLLSIRPKNGVALHLKTTILFSCTSQQTNFAAKNKIASGELHLIDLAACDIIREIGNDSELTFNKSLEDLKTCVNALQKKSACVTFHKSILTRLLHPALTGNFQSLMIVNISPFIEKFSCSKFALDFGLMDF